MNLDRLFAVLRAALICTLAGGSLGSAGAAPDAPPSSLLDKTTATPEKIAGGIRVGTAGVLALEEQHVPVHYIDVAGADRTLPEAVSAAWAGQPGDFNDAVQRQLEGFMRHVTRDNFHAPVVFFGNGPQHWGAYNAALRAIKLGYRGVRWYRGGTEAWRQDGEHLMPARRVPPPVIPAYGYLHYDIESPAVPRASSLAELAFMERMDTGVRASRALRASDALYSDTPNKIPGGQLITTRELLSLLKKGLPVHLVDTEGVAVKLPNASVTPWAGKPGTFDDDVQRRLALHLRELSRDDKSAALVFYGGGQQSWTSYNAALRAIRLGYSNVGWYRGGMPFWQHAGMPMEASATPPQVPR